MRHSPAWSQPKPLGDIRAIDQLCDEFEAAWESGAQPHLETYLERTPEGGAAETLLQDLLRIEVEQRRRRNEVVSVADYVRRLPQYGKVIQQLLLEATAAFQEPPPAGSPGQTTLDPMRSPSRHSPPSFFPGDLLGDYQLLEELGRGGMGIVFKARQLSAGGRLVALKLIRPDRLVFVDAHQREEILSRFRREALAAARLEHDHVLPVYDVGQVGGVAYYAMRYVAGPSLDRVVKDAPLANRDAVRYIRQVAEGLAAAHDQGILHRDLKPHNVLIDSATDRALLTDFGLAKISEQDQQLTATEAVFGSPPYMSPEQAWNAHLTTPASDVYSLGATLYHVLTGRPPFQAASALEVFALIKDAAPLAPSRLNPSVDRDLNAICLKCLEKSPKLRYPDARALADDLGRYLDQKPLVARPVGPLTRGIRWCRRRPLQATTLLLTVLIVATTLLGWHLRTRALDAQKLADAQSGRANAEQARAQAAEAARRVADFHAALQRSREENASRRAGWTYRSLAALRGAFPSAQTPEQHEQLRDAAVAPLVSVDLQPARQIDTDITPGCLAFDPRGRWLAVAELKAQAWLSPCRVLLKSLTPDAADLLLRAAPSVAWSVANGRQDGCCKVSFARDGSRLAVGLRSGLVFVWDLSRPDTPPLSWQAHAAPIARLEFGAERDALFTCARGLEIARWRHGAQPVKTAKYSLNPTIGAIMAYAAEADHLVVRDGTWRVLAGESLQQIRELPHGDDLLQDFSPDGRFTLVMGDGGLRVLPLEEGVPVLCVDPLVRRSDGPAAHNSEIVSARFATPSMILSIDKQKRTKIWDRLSGRLLAAITLSASEATPVIDAAGTTLAAENDQGISLLDLRGLHAPLLSSGAHHPRVLLHTTPSVQAGHAWVMTEAPHPENRSNAQASCLLLEIATGRVLKQVAEIGARREGALEGTQGLTVQPRGDAVAFTWHADGATLFDGPIGAVRPLPETGSLRAIRFSPQGDRLWAIRNERQAASWSFPALTPGASWDNSVEVAISGAGQLRDLFVGPTLVALAVRDGSVRLLSAEDAAPRSRLLGPGGEPVCVVLSQDEKWLAMGTRDGVIRVMRADGSDTPHDFPLHSDMVSSLVFSPDGRWLLSGGRDGAFHVLEIADQQPRRAFALPIQEGPIGQIAFNADTERVQYRIEGEPGIRILEFARLLSVLDKLFQGNE